MGTGVAGLALGVAALSVLGGVCMRGIGFHWSILSLADKFLVFTQCCLQRALALFGVGGVAVP